MQLPALEYSKGTISIDLVHEALLNAKAQHYDIAAILTKAAIPLEILYSAKARVSVAQYAALWTALADSMNDEFLAWTAIQCAVAVSNYYLKCCYRPIRWKSSAANPAIFNLILDDLHSTLMVEENFAYIVIYDQNQTKRMFSYATYLMLIHTLLCWLSGQRVLLNQIQLKCAAPLDDFDYKVRFCEQIEYQASENYIQFDAAYLQLPVKQDQTSWYQFIQQTPHNLLVRFKILMR